MTHLWEIDHPYYCNQGNYFSNGCSNHFDSWAEFFEDEGDSDPDMNLLFRWDWHKADPKGENWGNESDELLLFWIGQRKGLYRYTTVTVTDADEPAVRAWLTSRWNYLQTVWGGISQPQSGDGTTRAES